MSVELGIETKGALGIIRLNRPKAINALTLEMVAGMDAALTRFAADPAIAAVLISGEGERGLCAGGDIRALYDHRAEGTGPGLAFFAAEYRLNAQIASFPKPYIAIMDGITMGGGVGISAHGSVRIVTERTRLAMPETGIGFFPDVGASWLLSRAPGELGTYLALTGQIIGGADAILAGLADALVESTSLPALRADLEALPASATRAEIIALLPRAVPEAKLAAQLDLINRCFAFDDASQIVQALTREGSAFAQETLDVLAQKSPTGIQVALRLLRAARTSADVRDCLQREYAACAQVLATGEFYEGVRAAVVDKDRQPKWNPASLAEITPALIEPYFRPARAQLF